MADISQAQDSNVIAVAENTMITGGNRLVSADMVPGPVPMSTVVTHRQTHKTAPRGSLPAAVVVRYRDAVIQLHYDELIRGLGGRIWLSLPHIMTHLVRIWPSLFDLMSSRLQQALLWVFFF